MIISISFVDMTDERDDVDCDLDWPFVTRSKIETSSQCLTVQILDKGHRVALGGSGYFCIDGGANLKNRSN